MSHRILIVDDEIQIRRFLRISLEANNYRVLEADSGQNALAQAVLHRPDVIILDMNLPDLPGVEVLRRRVGAAPMDAVVPSCDVGPATETAERHDDALAHPDVLEDTCELEDDILLDRPLPCLALDGHIQSGETVGLRTDHIDLMGGAGPTLEDHVGSRDIPVGRHHLCDALFELRALLKMSPRRCDVRGRPVL